MVRYGTSVLGCLYLLALRLDDLASAPCLLVRVYYYTYFASVSFSITGQSSTSSGAPMLKVYGFRLSQPTRSVLLLLEACKQPYEFVVVDGLKGENRKPDFQKISRTGLLPAIQDSELGGGFLLAEAPAILVYLAETRRLSDWHSPIDAQARAEDHFWMSWHHLNTRMSTKQLLHPTLFPKMPNAQDLLKQGKLSMSKSMKFLESNLADTKFLGGGSHPTVADLLLLPEVDQVMPGAFNLFDFAPYPHVQRWVADVKAVLGDDVYRNSITPVQEIAAKISKNETFSRA